MKKTLAILTALVLSLTFVTEALAGSISPAPSYDPKTKSGAWSYVKVVPVSGESSRTHFLFSNYYDPSTNEGGIASTCAGMKYDKDSNTLTMTKFAHSDCSLLVHNMGAGFKLKLVGANKLRNLKVDTEGWGSGLTINGSGSITLGDAADRSRIPLEIQGKTTFQSGTIKCIAEQSASTTTGSKRYSFYITHTNVTPLTTFLKVKAGKITGSRMNNGAMVIQSKGNVTMSGRPLATPSVKRTKNKVTWKKVSGANRYEVKMGNIVKTTSKTYYNTSKKACVRSKKVAGGVIYYGAWSKIK